MLSARKAKDRLLEDKRFQEVGSKYGFPTPSLSNHLCGDVLNYNPIRYGLVAAQSRNTSLITPSAPVSSFYTNTAFQYCLKEKTNPTRKDGLSRQQWKRGRECSDTGTVIISQPLQKEQLVFPKSIAASWKEFLKSHLFEHICARCYFMWEFSSLQ